MFGWLLLPAPASTVVTGVSGLMFVMKALLGISEVKGKHVEYAKFSKTSPPTQKESSLRLSGRKGMLLFYAPSLVTAAASTFFHLTATSVRGLMVRSALTIHFLKRVLEVLFIHKFGNDMPLDTVIPVSTSYLLGTATTIYAHHLAAGMPEPQIDLKYPGAILFAIGISGNFYHHYLFSKLRRSKDDKGYKIPKGGLFGLVICPHYLFEIIGFLGLSFISQTLYSCFFSFSTVFYLMGRSVATRRWYVSKFEDFPKEVKALVPYIL